MKKLLILIPFFLLTGCTLASHLVYVGEEETPKTDITILDQKSISRNPKKGIPFSEISDLAYDQKTHKLYMIGDKGNFYIFNAKFDYDIKTFNYLNGFKLREKHQKSSYDSEGLTIDNRGQLYISFEKYPRISKISKNGYIQTNQKLTKQLSRKQNYKNANSIFEALAWHPKYGLLTAAEYPMFRRQNRQQTIYSLKGRKWNFQAEKYKNSAITAIEVMDDSNLLILERAYAGLSKPIVITLKKLYLNKCTKSRKCKTKVLASFNSFDGWSVANYEGLTKVGKNRYLMVSDNGNKSYLSTTFIYFEVKE